MNWPKRMKLSNLLWKFNRQCFILYQQEEMTKLSQINSNNIINNYNSNNNNNNNNKLKNCCNTINKQCLNSTSSKYNKIKHSKYTTTATTAAKQQQSHLRNKTQQQLEEPKNQNRPIYAGNLYISVTENDLYDLWISITVNKVSSRNMQS